jgi:class 3 adenylate cyclase
VRPPRRSGPCRAPSVDPPPPSPRPSATTGHLDGTATRFDVGLHCGASLYIGQLIPGSRLEVTALGDEVNECARIEEAASAGIILASKPFMERIDADMLEACAIDPGDVVYRPLAEVPGVSDKAVRDAGTLAVTRILIRN